MFANGAKLGRLWAGRLPSWGEEGARTPFMDVTPVPPQPTADDSHPSPASKHGWPGVVRSRRRAGLTGSKQRSGMRAWRSGVILPGRKKEDGPPAFVAPSFRVSPRPSFPASQRLARRAAGARGSSSREGRERVHVDLRRIRRRRGLDRRHLAELSAERLREENVAANSARGEREEGRDRVPPRTIRSTRPLF